MKEAVKKPVLIHRETVNGTRRKEIYELFKTQEFTQPEIYILKPTGDTLMIHGTDELGKYINEDKIPAGFEVVRVESGLNSGVTYTDSSAVAVRIFIPKEDRVDLAKIKMVFAEAVAAVLAKHGVTARLSSHRAASNDMVFFKSGQEKKFCGCIHDMRHSYLGFILTFDFRADKITGLYKTKTAKMLSRGADVKGVEDVVGGLKEANYDIDASAATDDLIAEILDKMNWTI